MGTLKDLPPIALVFNGDNIPTELKILPRWALWKALWNDNRGKYDKIPYHPDGYGLSTKNVDRWVSFDIAKSALDQNSQYSGLGFVLTDVKDIVGIDLDNCYKDGQMAPWAKHIVDTVNSYTEISPSGNGLRIICNGNSLLDWNNHDVGLEVYAGNTPRFLTMTGDTKLAKPVRTAPAAMLDALFSQYGKSRTTHSNVIPITMPDLIPDVLLPDVKDMDIPDITKDMLLNGFDVTDDRSGALHAIGVQLYSAGFDDAEVLSILADSEHVMEIALAHRRDDPVRALQYLWVEHCTKAKPKAITRDAILSDFEDISNDPEVIASAALAAIVAQKKADRFKLQLAQEFVIRRKSSWLVKGVIPQAQMGVIYGASGSGKSFFVLNLLGAIAQGHDWRNHRTTKANVCWIAAEGQEDMRKRVFGYCQDQGISPETFTMQFVDEAPNFLEEIDIKTLITQVRKADIKFDVIVVDTLAQVMAGGNENSSEDMGRVLAYCKQLTRELGAMVILIHHSGKDESRGARGWSGLRAAADFELEVLRSGDDRVAVVTKMKGGEDGSEFGFHLETVVVGQDEDGEAEVTCIVRDDDGTKQSVKASTEPAGEIQKTILSCAAQLLGDDPTVTRQLLIDNAINMQTRDPNAVRDTRPQKTKTAFNALLSAGRLLLSTEGLVSLPKRST